MAIGRHSSSLAASEGDVEIPVFPDDGHSFLLYRKWLRAFDASIDFFERTLADRKPPFLDGNWPERVRLRYSETGGRT